MITVSAPFSSNHPLSPVCLYCLTFLFLLFCLMMVGMAQCPRGRRCECCGQEVPGIAVAITDSPVGTFCISACLPCRKAIERGTPPPVSLGTAIRLAAQHQTHTQDRVTIHYCPACTSPATRS